LEVVIASKSPAELLALELEALQLRLKLRFSFISPQKIPLNGLAPGSV
jgi:hypothetical protein